jgi:hypothetical protein
MVKKQYRPTLDFFVQKSSAISYSSVCLIWLYVIIQNLIHLQRNTMKWINIFMIKYLTLPKSMKNYYFYIIKMFSKFKILVDFGNERQSWKLLTITGCFCILYNKFFFLFGIHFEYSFIFNVIFKKIYSNYIVWPRKLAIFVSWPSTCAKIT